MTYGPIFVTLVVAAVIGYFVYKRINKEKLMLESSSKVLRAVALFMQFIMYFAMVVLALVSIGILLNQSRFGDMIHELDLHINFSSSLFEANIDASQTIIDNLVSLIMVFLPIALYGLFISSLIAKHSAKIFKILSDGVVFSQEILSNLKRVITYFIFLFPVSLFTITLKNEHGFSIGINLEFIATFVFFYIIFAVYKRALEVYEESQLTI